MNNFMLVAAGSRRIVGSDGTYRIPEECNRKIQEKGCIPIHLSRVKKRHGANRWTLIDQGKGQQRNLVGVYNGRLTGGEEDDFDEEELNRKSISVTNTSEAQVKLTKFEEVVDLSQAGFLSGDMGLDKRLKL
jgi:hypothetical protein